MIKQLITIIESHPATRHDVFSKLAQRKLEPLILADYLREMGAFCQASRDGGRIAETLATHTLNLQAGLVGEIFKSEAGHNDSFAHMARLLLQGSPYADEDWRFLPASRASTAVQKAANIFDIRCGTTNLEILYSLGALLPLEMAAHRQIIPGEVTAFVTSGHYGLTLSDIPYLAEHAGECGAEHLHENAITVLINSLDVDHDPEFEDKVMHGCREFLDALEGFYDSLKRIISVAS